MFRTISATCARKGRQRVPIVNDEYVGGLHEPTDRRQALGGTTLGADSGNLEKVIALGKTHRIDLVGITQDPGGIAFGAVRLE